MKRTCGPLGPRLAVRLSLAACAALALLPVARGLCDTTGASAQLARVPTARTAGGLENRVQVLTKELDLKADQQRRVRLLLTQQRDEVRRIWDNSTLSPAERAPATRAANEKTGDAIRALLDDQQKQKYNSVKPSTARPQGERRSVDQWLAEAAAR